MTDKRMSDVFEGPGWWMASDGKWYAPHLHHDESYRARFAQLADAGHVEESHLETTTIVTPPLDDEEEVEVADEVPVRPTADVGPSLGSMPMPVVTPVPGSVDEMLSGETVTGWKPTAVEPEIDQERVTNQREKQTFSRPIPVSEIFEAQSATSAVEDDFAADTTVDVEDEQADVEVETAEVQVAPETDEPVEDASEHEPEQEPEPEQVWETLTIDTDTITEAKEDARLASLDLMGGADVEDEVAPAQATSMRAKLEIGKEQPAVADPFLRRSDAIGRISTSTDLVPVSLPAPEPEEPPITWYDRGVALTLFLSGVAMIVGSFATWVDEPSGLTTGWALGDGVATIAAGVLGSAAAGPIFVGFRHVVPKTIAIVSGIVGTVVAGLTGLRTLTDSDAAATSLGVGFWVVLIGSIAMLAAGIADRSKV